MKTAAHYLPITPIVLLGILLTGCQTVPITSVPIPTSPTSAIPGPVYFLPRTDIEVTAVFEVYVKKSLPNTPTPSVAAPADTAEVADGTRATAASAKTKAARAADGTKVAAVPAKADGAADDSKGTSAVPLEVALFLAEIDKPLSVATYLVPNLSEGFSLSDKDDLLADTSYQITLSEWGLLTSYNATLDDKSASVVTNSIGAVSSALLGFKAKEDQSFQWIKTGIRYTLDTRFSAKRVPTEGSFSLFSTQMENIKNNQNDPRLRAVVGTYQFNSYPTLTIALAEPDLVKQDIKAQPEHSTFFSVPGIYYKLPNPKLLVINLSDNPVLTIQANIADTAPAAYVEVKGRRFSKRSDELTFSSTTGTLTTHKRTSTSAADNSVQAFKTSIDALAKLKTDLSAAQTAANAQQTSEQTAEFTRARTLAGLLVDKQIFELQIAQLDQQIQKAAVVDQPTLILQKLALQKQLDQLNVTITALQNNLTLPKE